MKVLLDTHVFLWMLVSPDRFREEARTLLEDARNDLLLSAVSSWEIAIKHSIGRLELPDDPVSYIPDRMLRAGVSGLSITHRHALEVSSLRPHHCDPFDRLLVAQARVESAPIVTADPLFSRYDVEIISA